MEWINGLISFFSVFAAVLAWLAKIRWSQEYSQAKDEIIRAKEAQIELLKDEIVGLKDLTPMKIREYFLSTKLQLEEFNDKLLQQLKDANQEIEKLNTRINLMQEEGALHSEQIDKLITERDKIEKTANDLRKLMEEQKPDIFTVKGPVELGSFIKWVDQVNFGSASLSEYLGTKDRIESPKDAQLFYEILKNVNWPSKSPSAGRPSASPSAKKSDRGEVHNENDGEIHDENDDGDKQPA